MQTTKNSVENQEKERLKKRRTNKHNRNRTRRMSTAHDYLLTNDLTSISFAFAPETTLLNERD